MSATTTTRLHLLRGENAVGVRGTDDPEVAIAWLREHFQEWAEDFGLDPFGLVAGGALVWDDPEIVAGREAFLADLSADRRPYGPWCHKGWLRWNPQAPGGDYTHVMHDGRPGQRGSFLGCMWWLG